MFKYLSKNCRTIAASYSAANAIARHGKPFQEGAFLKEAWLACAPSLFDDFDNKDKIIQRVKDVPLSRNTMKDRILKLAENVTDQQQQKKNDINSAPFISLCLDESNDITKSARLAVFARYCIGNIIKEELIAITLLLTTTKSTNICTAKKWHVDPKRIATPALGAVLLQGEDKEEHPAEFASRLLNPAERNYSTTEREALAVVWALNKFRGYN
ncbi:uncharacterized protein TNCV_2392701 [Trichonephila clavipes]|nr:uncharacterized protein TNCV_2392701 [Trichonephila clavipes]